MGSEMCIRDSARAGAALHGVLGDGVDGVGGELQLDAVELEELLVLLDQGVAGLGEDLDQRLTVELGDARDERQATDELGDEPELGEVLRTHQGQQVLGLTLGNGTQLFVLDPATGTFHRSQARTSIPSASAEVALNASNVRHWDDAMRTFFTDLVDGSQGPYGRDFTIRWVGAVAAETYRILRSGGLFLYPADHRPGLTHGRLHLVYQAQPIALLVEQAGGIAVDGSCDILDKTPTECHERTPLIFGSRDVVHEMRHYLTTPGFTGEHSPLFRRFGLFRR